MSGAGRAGRPARARAGCGTRQPPATRAGRRQSSTPRRSATDSGDRTSCTSSRTSRAGPRSSRIDRSSSVGAVAGRWPVSGRAGRPWPRASAAACRAPARCPASRAGSSSDASKLDPADPAAAGGDPLPQRGGLAVTGRARRARSPAPGRRRRRGGRATGCAAPGRGGRGWAWDARSQAVAVARGLPAERHVHAVSRPWPPVPRERRQRSHRSLDRVADQSLNPRAPGRATYFTKTLSLLALCRCVNVVIVCTQSSRSWDQLARAE